MCTPVRTAVVVGGGLVAIASVCGLMLDRFYSDPAVLPPDDFLQYWAAGRLHATGGNPYDADQLLPLQQSAGRPTEKPAVVMWNPPWSLTLATPFGLLDPRTGQLLWLAFQLAALVWCADRLWAVYGGSPRHRPWVWAAALGFYPTMYTIFAGQSGGWLLLGATGLLLASARGPVWLALLGAFAALKPHLFLPLWVVLALQACVSRRDRMLIAVGVAGGLIAMAVPTLVNPGVWSQYLAAFDRPTDDSHPSLSGWQSPLIGYWVRATVAPEAFWIQVVPTVIGLVLTIAYWRVRNRSWDWATEFPRLILIGLIVAPYGAWPYDQLVLLIPVAAGAASLVRNGSSTRVAIGLGALAVVNGVSLLIREGSYFVWVPPAVAVWYVWATAVREPNAALEPIEDRTELEVAR